VENGGVNPREIKRYLNAYTISIKIKPQLERNVMLALQTVAFRRDWESVERGLLSYREIFIDALKRRVLEHDLTAIADLDPTLTDIPESFFSYVSAPNPGAVLLNAQNLDVHIYSGQATRSSLSTLFLDAIRDVAQLTKHIRGLQSAANLDFNTLSPYSSLVSSATSMVQQAGGVRFAGISNEWMEHVNLAVSQTQGPMDEENKKQWISDEEAFRRRMMNLLMETYQLGSTVTPT